jgi:hypothetical protein
MRITMRSNNALLDRFDYLNELIGHEQRRTTLLTTACQITLDKLKADEDIFLKAQKLKVRSYKRDSMPENIKIEIDDELYGKVRKNIKDYFHLVKVQNPFVCKLVLSVYIMHLVESTCEGTAISNVTSELPFGNFEMGVFTSDLDRIVVFTHMLKQDRKYVDQIDEFLSKWVKEIKFKGGNLDESELFKNIGIKP